MPEKLSGEKNVPVTPGHMIPRADDDRAAPGQPPGPLAAEASKVVSPPVGGGEAAKATPPSPAETKPIEAQPRPLREPVKNQYNWALIPIIVLLLFIFVLFLARPRPQGNAKNMPALPSQVEENADLSNYADFVAKNRALNEEKYSETILTDEPYAGQAPMAARPSGPLLSPEIDPQLAALADALKIRLRHIQGSQLLQRGRASIRTTKGDFRGFRVHAVENLENEIVVSEEITVTTPQNGSFKTMNRILEDVQRTDFARINSELQNAGLELSVLPMARENQNIRVGLHAVHPWGRPIPAGLLIAGKSVGGISLGMPVAQIRSKLDASYEILKRKILVNDVYFDVFKITGQGAAPLLYVYEKDGRVWGISVVSDVFRTARGIGIGSSLDVIRLNHPSVTLAHSTARPSFIRIAEVDGIFIVQSDGDKKVISILIGQSPEFE